jgi:hypothetical protein
MACFSSRPVGNVLRASAADGRVEHSGKVRPQRFSYQDIRDESPRPKRSSTLVSVTAALRR